MPVIETVMGVDPGAVSAAWGVIPWDEGGGLGAAFAQEMPVVDRMVDAKAFVRILLQHCPTHAVIERVNAFPKQGVSSSFRFGCGYGIILGALAGQDVQIIDVAPSVWKKHFKLSADKEQARALAIKRFPHVDLGRKKDTGRAEALLMALWLRETAL
jgi:Holliday junction resolvasome RuvABC endonuclease subunit